MPSDANADRSYAQSERPIGKWYPDTFPAEMPPERNPAGNHRRAARHSRLKSGSRPRGSRIHEYSSEFERKCGKRKAGES